MNDSSPFLMFLFGVLAICSIVLSIKTAFFSAQPQQRTAQTTVITAPKTTVKQPVQTQPIQTQPIQAQTIQQPTETATIEAPVTQPIEQPVPQGESPFDFVEEDMHYTALLYGEPITEYTGNIQYWIYPIVGTAWCETEQTAQEFGRSAGERFSMIIVDYEFTNMSDTNSDYIYPELSIMLDNDSKRLEVDRNSSNFALNNSIMPNEFVDGNIAFLPNTDWTNSTSLDFYLYNAISDTEGTHGNYTQLHFDLQDISLLLQRGL